MKRTTGVKKEKTETSVITGNNIVESFLKNLGSREALLRFLDFFPYMIEVFTPDGILVFINRAACEDMEISTPDKIIGIYNINNDPVVMGAPGMQEFTARVLKGETLTVSGVRFIKDDQPGRNSQTNLNYSDVKFRTITGFPVRDNQHKLAYTVMVFQNTQMFRGRKEITMAEEYINQNWLNEYDLEKIAENSGLSPFHFSRLFKQLTGVTPYTYYRKIKISRIREKLCDPNLNVQEAFSVCGVNYRGKYFKYFRDYTGITPSEYKQKYINQYKTAIFTDFLASEKVEKKPVL